jgi:tetratricopeptide (TPR) repeat protein
MAANVVAPKRLVFCGTAEERGPVDEAGSSLVEARRVAELRTKAEVEPDSYLAPLMETVTTLSNRLAEFGYLQESIDYAEEAVDLVETMMERHPGGRRGSYARAMNALGVRLRTAGRLTEAIAVSTEAVDVARDLEKDEPHRRADAYGRYSYTLGLQKQNAGAWEAGLAHQIETVESVRAARAVTAHAHEQLYGAVLAAQIRSLMMLGRRDEAMAIAKRMFNMWRASSEGSAPARLRAARVDIGWITAVMRWDPDGSKIAIERDMTTSIPEQDRSVLWQARAWYSYAGQLCDSGHLDTAGQFADAAIEQWRAFAASQPGAFRHQFAEALETRRRVLRTRGRHANAADDAVELVAIWRDLAANDPARYASALGRGLSEGAGLQSRAGRSAEALDWAAEAVRILRPHATENPQAYDVTFVRALHNKAFVNHLAGHHEVASISIEEAVTILRGLSAQIPTAFDEDLGNALRMKVDVDRARGHAGDAGAALLEADRLAPKTKDRPQLLDLDIDRYLRD